MKGCQWIALVALLVIVGPTQAQTKKLPSNYKHLKKLQPLVGKFTGESVAVGTPGIVEKGTKLSWTLTRKWILNKNAIAQSVILKAGKKTLWRTQGMIGWDSLNKQIVQGGFDSVGGHGMSTWNWKDGKWYLQDQGAMGPGLKSTSTTIVCDITKDSHDLKIVSRMVGVNTLPDIGPITMKRAKK
ncbi:MAG: hypothetical protein ACFCD0_11375 [Gemmataceae bacterium]